MRYQDYIKLISTQIPFAFSRYGDGEWQNIRMDLYPGSTHNCDGNTYYPDLGKRLEEIVSTRQNYYMAIQRPSVKNWPWLKDTYKQNWVDSDIFHEASKQSHLKELFEVLEQVNVIYIGNIDLAKLPFIDTFIEIPQNNCWDSYESYLQQIKEHITDEYKVFLFSAGMAANVFVHDLWEYNKNNSYIDIGSIFDPYVGKKTRSYHSRLNLK